MVDRRPSTALPFQALRAQTLTDCDRMRQPHGNRMRYQIEADWHLLNICNYRCDYCFFSDEFLSAKLPTFATAEQPFVRRTSAAPCDTSYCFYFCQKYADKQNGRPIGRPGSPWTDGISDHNARLAQPNP